MPDEEGKSEGSSTPGACHAVSPPSGHTGRPIRIFVASPEAIFRAGLRQLLNAGQGCALVGELDDAADVVERVVEAKPDLLFLDHSLVRSDDRDLLRELGRRLAVRTLVVGHGIAPQEAVDCLKRGASGVLLKSASEQLLLRCIDAVMRGQYWIDRAVTGDLVAALRHYEGQPPALGLDRAALTRIDREILVALAEGESNKRIARRLGIAEQTVKNRLSHLYARLGVSNRLALVLVARHRGLV